MKYPRVSVNAAWMAVLSIVLTVAGPVSAFAAPSASKASAVFQKGMCYVTYDKERYASEGSDASLDALASTGTEWISVVVTWYQDKAYSTKIYPTEKSPNDASVVHAIQKIHSLGKKVMLKPHVDLMTQEGGSWRGEISCPSDVEWEQWFASYADFILKYAVLAQENDVEIYCIGTELSCVATTKENFWRSKVIGPVRSAYKGPITYAANWSDEFQRVKFWDAVDYIGIDAYFPLSESVNPNVDEIRQGWEKWVKEIEDVQARTGKPVIFPEVGYCSADGTARTPYEEIVTGKANLKLQADCYEALFQTFWEKPYFYGMYWWKWGTDVRFGGSSNKGYTIQNKSALDVLKTWYKKKVVRGGSAATATKATKTKAAKAKAK